MADSYVQGPPNDLTGEKIDTDLVTVGANQVHRERSRLSGLAAAEIADVKNAAPGAAAYGLVTRTPEPSTAALTSSGQNVSTGTLLAANALRRGFVIVNETDVEDLLVAFSATASLTVYTRRIPPGESWERHGGYTGVISGIWTGAGSGNARVTEET
jgi:hypothetical protein